VNIEVIDDGSVSCIRPEGKLDSTTSAWFEAAMLDVVESRSSSILVDLGQVSFMASAGLRALLGTAKRMAGSERALRVYGLNALVRETFEISGFVSIIDVRDDEAHALEGLA